MYIYIYIFIYLFTHTVLIIVVSVINYYQKSYDYWRLRALGRFLNASAKTLTLPTKRHAHQQTVRTKDQAHKETLN